MKTNSFSFIALLCSGALLLTSASIKAAAANDQIISHSDVLPIILNRCSKCHNSQPKLDIEAIPPNLQNPQLFVQENINDPEGIRELLRKEIFTTGDMPKEGPKVDKWSENERRLLLGFINGQTFNEAMAEKLPTVDKKLVTLHSIDFLSKKIINKTQHNKSEKSPRATREIRNDIAQHLRIARKLKAGTLTDEERKKFIGASGKIIAGGGWKVYREILLLEGDEEKMRFDFDDLSKEQRQQLYDWLEQTGLEVSPMEFREAQDLYDCGE